MNNFKIVNKMLFCVQLRHGWGEICLPGGQAKHIYA